MTRKIIITHEFPPIPDRRFDWCASRDGGDMGDPVGYGRTPQDAIIDLLDNEEAMAA